MEIFQLSSTEQNVLIASILGDGEITKIYPGSRRRNNSYREHFSPQQLPYRLWKMKSLPSNFYLNKANTVLQSPSIPLLTEMFPYFYNHEGNKIISVNMLTLCNSPLFLATLYMDDGSLSISVQKNHLKKLIYLTPNIYLYLQCFSHEHLVILQSHILTTFKVEMSLIRRKDGFGFVLKTMKVSETIKFLHIIQSISADCPSMFYKTNWTFRFEKEVEKFKISYPDYQVIASDSERMRNYTDEECNIIHRMKRNGHTDKEIADVLNRSYWSVVYKWREIRRDISE